MCTEESSVNLSEASFLLAGHWFDMFIAFFLGRKMNKLQQNWFAVLFHKIKIKMACVTTLLE